jgi:hypothetical protein
MVDFSATSLKNIMATFVLFVNHPPLPLLPAAPETPMLAPNLGESA